jgi:hypothetical protein
MRRDIARCRRTRSNSGRTGCPASSNVASSSDPHLRSRNLSSRQAAQQVARRCWSDATELPSSPALDVSSTVRLEENRLVGRWRSSLPGRKHRIGAPRGDRVWSGSGHTQLRPGFPSSVARAHATRIQPTTVGTRVSRAARIGGSRRCWSPTARSRRRPRLQARAQHQSAP